MKIWLPSSWEHIKAIVKNGWVTLEGEVEWNYQRDYAERAIRWVKGVKGVSNLIRLRPQATPSPVEIKRKIEEAFRRSALVDANRKAMIAVADNFTRIGIQTIATTIPPTGTTPDYDYGFGAYRLRPFSGAGLRGWPTPGRRGRDRGWSPRRRPRPDPGSPGRRPPVSPESGAAPGWLA